MAATIRVRRCFAQLWLFSAVAAMHLAAHASNTKANAEVVVLFEPETGAITSASKAQLAEALNRIRTQDWCSLHYAAVMGQHSSNPAQLESERRNLPPQTKEVAKLLQHYGIPVSVITIPAPEILVSEHLNHSRVVVIFEGTPGGQICAIPKNPGGFRVP